MRTRIGDWMCTFTGVQYYPADPRSTDVHLIDIAHALSMLCRYTGHCREFYSVAEHSVLVSQIVPREYALVGLLHDATEAYINDINRPLKRSLPDYNKIEDLNWLVIAERFGLPAVIPEVVHSADMAVLKTEARALMPDAAHHWNLPGDAAKVSIRCWSPRDAEAVFTDRFFDLIRARDHGIPVEYLDPEKI